MKTILFDHDGTLVDSEIVHYYVWRDVLVSYGVSLSEQDYKLRYAGIPTAGNALDIVERYALQMDASALAREKSNATRKLLSEQSFPLMPGARESIAFFRERGCRLAGVSGAERHVIESTLAAHGMAGDFELVVSGDDVRNGKPAPDCYQLAMRQLGISIADCVAIEDTEHGLKAAVSAGVTCAAIPNAMSEHQDFSRAAGVFSSLDEATRWIAQHLQIGR
jgi:HAD superfamily hydrolase (TIGR01509 family)